MQNVIRFLDRQGEYKEMHVISIHYSTDSDNEEIVIELAGIDDTCILSLSNEASAKLGKELMAARSAIDQIRSRKRRVLKEKGVITADLEAVLTNKDIDDLYKGTMFEERNISQTKGTSI